MGGISNPSSPLNPLNPANPSSPTSPLNPMNQDEWGSDVNTDITAHELLYALLVVGVILAAIVLITIVINALLDK